MRKLVFCLIALCLIFILIPVRLIAQPTVISDSLVALKPFERSENRSIGLGLKRINMTDTTRSGLSEKEKQKTEGQTSKRSRNGINGTLYISFGIELVITLLVIILL
jgi:hypothetical protein